MVRMQVQFTEEQAKALKWHASKRGVSIAQVVREAVDKLGIEEERARLWKRALEAVGSAKGIEGEPRDVARNHDRYLADAIEG